jgi:plastocyanin
MRAMRLFSTAITTAGLLVLALSVGVAVADSTVHIRETNGRYAYTPTKTTVAVGDTVTWTNDSDAPHTVDADDGSFDHGQFTQGKSVSETFSTAGTFAYHCDVHPYMTGTLVVLAAGVTPPATDTAPLSTPGDGNQSIAIVLGGFGLLALTVAFFIQMRRRAA